MAFDNKSLFFGLGAGVVLTYTLMMMSASFSGEVFSFGSSSQSKGVFQLVVSLKFTGIQDKLYFETIFKPLAAYVQRNEAATTLSYVMSENDSDEKHVQIFERYKDKEDAYLTIHKSSQQFLDFRAKLKEMERTHRVKIEGQSYVEKGIGYI
jgi:quinol monooxygenase YgiN